MGKPINYRQVFAKKRENETRIKRICPEITSTSGIYAFYRKNEENQWCVYVGQAVDLLKRTAQHLEAKQQHIDKSLYKHKLFSRDNPFGWQLKVLCSCSESELDAKEQYYIDYFLKGNYKIYNVTGGGQFDKKSDIGERQQTKLKSYKNGKGLGYEKARNKVKVFFEKYLDYTIKGKSNKTKERKFAEFTEFLTGNDESGK